MGDPVSMEIDGMSEDIEAKAIPHELVVKALSLMASVDSWLEAADVVAAALQAEREASEARAMAWGLEAAASALDAWAPGFYDKETGTYLVAAAKDLRANSEQILATFNAIRRS